MEGIYILHYNAKNNAGGQHYTGLSKFLERRIVSHYLGVGSKHTTRMHELGFTFELGGLFDYEPTIKIERSMKQQTKRRCILCNGNKDTKALRRDWMNEINLLLTSSPSVDWRTRMD